jgi:DegV family protein with EDD domain
MYDIYTDTSANLPGIIVKKYSLQVIPLHYTVNGITYPMDNGTDSFDGKLYYDLMRKGAVVKTSMINTSAFSTAFTQSLSGGKDVLYIGMSSGISGSHQAALAAAAELREQYPDRKIAVIDTRAASLGEGLPVLFAARLRESGAPFDEVVSKAEKNSASICQYFTVEDLMYLKRGGRISGAAAIVGNILQVKPILKGDIEGKIVLCQKERGRKRALEALVSKYQELATDKNAAVGIAHADCEEDANHLAHKIKESGHSGELIMECYEPVTGSHVGPGTVALFFYGTHR